ncbi:MAG: dihydrofolate reductase [Proteobacteria bacterium]|nr:MAG: dihydrofolate reductase [Pseudomonadota bacterium]
MRNRLILLAVAASPILGCGSKETQQEPTVTGTPDPQATTTAAPPADPSAAAAPDPSAVAAADPSAAAAGEFEWVADQFADLRVLRFQVPGFEALDLKTKKLLYFLYEAALSGRDILWDQKFAHGLTIRRTLEAIDATWQGPRDTAEWRAFQTFLKRVWFSYGIHHHYSTRKLEPGFDAAWFATLVDGADADRLPLADGETPAALAKRLTPILFDPAVAAQGVNSDPTVDMVAASANNFYGPGVTQAEVEAFYAAKKDPKDERPVMHGLNSKLVKRADGTLEEIPWKVGGMYGPAIERIVYWLKKASEVSENDAQRAALDAMVRFYESGDLADFDAYSIAWVADTGSFVDNVNGFIETYGDPLDMRATFEAMVSIRDAAATERIAAISRQAQWFEDHSPIADAYKKPSVTGIAAKVITVVVGAGDTQPSFPLGVNLPNSDWIRAEHGSKSVALGNIVHAYEEASKRSGLLDEFCATAEELARAKAHKALSDHLHTDMHEVIGHASGRLKEGVGTPTETLKNYAAVLEESRADLVALYYLMDPKLVEIGVMPSLEVGKAGYDDYLRNGLLVQLARLSPGEQLEQTHMRDRALVSRWAVEQGAAEGVVDRVVQDGKTGFVIRDYDKLRVIFGRLLAEIQRIKSEGDYQAGKALVEGYGVKVDPTLHAEVLERYAKLGIKPYSGFINPKLTPVMEGDEIVDVTISYPDDFAAQMREYSSKYSLL